MNPIVFAIVVVVVLGLAGGVILVLASKFMAVYEDPRIAQVTECLAGANCGGCGYAGCADYAKAIVENGAPTFKCAPGGDKTADAINTIMGNATDDRPSLRATVICAGGENCGKRFDYQGIQTCAAAASIAGGPSACAYGCLGLGDCTRACKFDAIHVINGVAVVDRKKCTGCTACTVTCPRHVIQMKPIAPQPAVKCSNKDKGALVNKTCKVGCIACGLCVRNCPNQAIFLKDNVAVIDYTKCNGCGTCVSKCPKKAIQWVEGTPRPIDAPVPVINGVAVVDRKKCTGCTACTVTCPRHVIQMKPIAPQPAVKCSNKDKGALVNKTCKVGCIACGLCVRNCPNQAIFLKDNVAVIDYTKCNGCGTCVSKCPKKAIQWVEGTPRPIDAPVPAHEVLKTRV